MSKGSGCDHAYAINGMIKSQEKKKKKSLMFGNTDRPLPHDSRTLDSTDLWGDMTKPCTLLSHQISMFFLCDGWVCFHMAHEGFIHLHKLSSDEYYTIIYNRNRSAENHFSQHTVDCNVWGNCTLLTYLCSNTMGFLHWNAQRAMYSCTHHTHIYVCMYVLCVYVWFRYTLRYEDKMAPQR